jgi:nucleotide-binding universal stress UspA family protein
MNGIACCVDASSDASAVVRVALWLANSLELELVLVHVAPHTNVPGVAAAVGGQERLRAEEHDEAEAVITRVVAAAGLPSDIRTRAEIGAVGERIVEICAEEDAALVVVGSRRRGGLKAAVLGSTSQHVVGHAPCSCVVVPTRQS